MRRLLLLSLVTSAFVSCSHDFGTYGSQIDPSTLKDKDPNEVTKEDIQANVANIFGAIDPEQDWNMVTSGTINVTADANLPGITKVQILTESPTTPRCSARQTPRAARQSHLHSRLPSPISV